MLTQDLNRRIIEALDETNRLMAKEMRYSPEFRKMDQIAFYERHIVKLTAALETQTMPEFGRS